MSSGDAGGGVGPSAGEPGDATGASGAGARCFVAVWPPAELVARLLASERPQRPGLRWTTAEQWHVTLKFFAAVDSDALAAALDGWAATSPGWPAAAAVAGPAPRAMSGRLWIVPVAGLDELVAAVEEATAGLGPGGTGGHGGADPSEASEAPGLGPGGSGPGGSGPGGRGPGGSGPGGRGPGGSGPGGPGKGRRDPGGAQQGGGHPGSGRPFRGHITLARARHPAALRHLPHPDLSARWQVGEIALVLSRLEVGGARHQVLRRWPVPSPPPSLAPVPG